MMKWGILVLILLVACAQPAIESQPERVEVVEKVVVQCWDGSTASSPEGCPPRPEEEKIVAQEIVEPEQKVTEEVPIGRQLLEKAQVYDGHAYEIEDRYVLVSGNKARHMFKRLIFIDRVPLSDVYVDLVSQTATAYCHIQHEEQMLGNQFTWSNSDCKHFVDEPKTMDFDDWIPKGPLHYLEEFADAQPEFVVDSLQTVTVLGARKSVQPVLHYSVDGVSVILHIDQRMQVPVQVDIKGKFPIGFKEVFFDKFTLYDETNDITGMLDYKNVSKEWLDINEQ